MSGLEPLLTRLGAALLSRKTMLATAESCTGGLVAAACTERPGSSRWFERGFVTYSNAAKVELLGVPAASIDAHGAVSAEVAQAMAAGALARSAAGVAVAITGIAGPDGGSPSKPIGTVWIAVARSARETRPALLQARGDRTSIRAQAVQRALELVLEAVEADDA